MPSTSASASAAPARQLRAGDRRSTRARRPLEACPNLSLLVTSRELLRSGARSSTRCRRSPSRRGRLFCGAPSEPTPRSELCRRLDNLPLASSSPPPDAGALPAQILERLAAASTCSREAETSRPANRRSARRSQWRTTLAGGSSSCSPGLSVFAGGCTLDAAEASARADLETIAVARRKEPPPPHRRPLLDARDDPEYAVERLGEPGEEIEAGGVGTRPGTATSPREGAMQWFGGRRAERAGRLKANAEHDNIRAALAGASGELGKWGGPGGPSGRRGRRPLGHERGRRRRSDRWLTGAFALRTGPRGPAPGAAARASPAVRASFRGGLAKRRSPTRATSPRSPNGWADLSWPLPPRLFHSRSARTRWAGDAGPRALGELPAGSAELFHGRASRAASLRRSRTSSASLELDLGDYAAARDSTPSPRLELARKARDTTDAIIGNTLHVAYVVLLKEGRVDEARLWAADRLSTRPAPTIASCSCPRSW